MIVFVLKAEEKVSELSEQEREKLAEKEIQAIIHGRGKRRKTRPVRRT